MRGLSWARSRASEPAARRKEFAAASELQGLTILLIVGMQYLLVPGRAIRVFGASDIRTGTGSVELKASVRAMATAVIR